MKKLRIVMAWGGTGGHVYPIRSMINFLDTHSEYYNHINTLYRAGSKHWLEQKEYSKLRPQHTQVEFVHVISGKFRRETRFLSILKNIWDLCRLGWGIVAAARFLHRKKIDVVFCKGWFIALPIVISAKILKIPVIVHESDTKPGLTNRIASRGAKQTFAWFDGVWRSAITVGQILSHEIVFQPDAKYDPTIQQQLDTKDPKKTYVLVLGGSLGARSIYETLSDMLIRNTRLSEHFHFLIIGGIANLEMKKYFSGFVWVTVFDYVSQHDMAALCHIADIAITRAGTTSLAELKLYNIKLIMIPIPWTHDQKYNALRYHRHYEDIILDQKKHNFTSTLDLILQQHKGFHKKPYNPDIMSSIIYTKHVISKAIFS